MKHFLKLLICGFLVAPAIALADGPSFDCAKASTPVELAICDSDRLSSLDLDLLNAYKAARDAGRTTRADQVAWLRRRDAECGGNEECLYRVIQDRVVSLEGQSSRPSSRTPASDEFLASEIQVSGQNYMGDTTSLTVCVSGSDVLNVRRGPSARKYDVVYEFLNGQTVEVIDRVTNEAGYDYYRVIYPQELSGGRLFDAIGFVYHEGLAQSCDVDFWEVVERNTTWPLELSGSSCVFRIADRETLDLWGDVMANDWRTEKSSQEVLCDETEAPEILVERYLGYSEGERKHYFQVQMHGCEARFSFQDDREKQQIIRSWQYDPKCLAELNRAASRQVRNSPDVGIGDLFGLAFGLGVQGVAAISGTTTEELAESMSDPDSFCYTLDDDDARYACLGEPYLTENTDARRILLGDCYSLSDFANDSGLREVCAEPGERYCYGMNNSDHAFACSTCNGSRQWAAVYATGNLLTCYR